MTQEMLQAKNIFEKHINNEAKRIVQLQGGFTNISFLIESGCKKYVIRIPGIGTNKYINRANEIENMHKLDRTGVIPAIYYSNAETGVIISQYIDNNRPFVKRDIEDCQKLKCLCNVLVKLHKVNIILNNEFDIISIKDNYKAVLDEMKIALPKKIVEVEPSLDRAVQYLFSKYPKQLVCCHGDPKFNNFLFSRKNMFLIDWEYSGMVDKYFDLVNLAMTNYLEEEQEKKCLHMYEMCAGEKIITEKYLLYKIITDYLWIYWHLIKFYKGQMKKYNEKSWKNRLARALHNLRIIEKQKG